MVDFFAVGATGVVVEVLVATTGLVGALDPTEILKATTGLIGVLDTAGLEATKDGNKANKPFFSTTGSGSGSGTGGAYFFPPPKKLFQR